MLRRWGTGGGKSSGNLETAPKGIRGSDDGCEIAVVCGWRVRMQRAGVPALSFLSEGN